MSVQVGDTCGRGQAVGRQDGGWRRPMGSCQPIRWAPTCSRLPGVLEEVTLPQIQKEWLGGKEEKWRYCSHQRQACVEESRDSPRCIPWTPSCGLAAFTLHAKTARRAEGPGSLADWTGPLNPHNACGPVLSPHPWHQVPASLPAWHVGGLQEQVLIEGPFVLRDSVLLTFLPSPGF